MYGKSSYAVSDKDGKEVMHTGFRNFNTYDELVEHVEKYPKFREMLGRATHILNDDESEDVIMNNEVYLLIVGSRNIDDYPYIKSYLNNLVRERYQDCNITVVSGGAKGVDKFAERWADENGYWKIVMPANWDRYGKIAGYRRNEEMHRFIADKENRLVVAFWDGKSKGTAHNFGLAKKYNNEITTVLMESAE